MPDRQPTVAIEVRSGAESLVIEAAGGAIRTRPETAAHPDAVLTGAPQLIVALLTGRLDLAGARAAGLLYDGDPAVLRRVRPAHHP